MPTTPRPSIRTTPSLDHRDEPGGAVSPFELIFELEGAEGRVVWPINTGWVKRPVVTQRMKHGRQARADRPGVDHHLVRGFPDAVAISVIQFGDPNSETFVDDLGDKLLDELITEGETGVFTILREVYRLHLAS